MSTVVVYFSGYGHTQRIAEVVAQGAEAELIAVDNNGDIPEGDWHKLAAASAIIFGAPTYMGGVPWQFKKFADASSKVWGVRGWQDKVFAGFTNSASLNGDKQVTLQYLQTLASQHGGIWVSLGLLPANTLAATRQDVNNLGGSVGLLVQSPADASADQIPQGDLDTALKFGQRVAAVAARLN
ncbi:flavodoxin family protein [Shimwellia pseudoproteus]|uniref:flavodoxin family protein n=1 Tax=Shimwellia pseudoproteus TaxID=570012 RepID=UPI0018EB3AB7|nr:flavodoxin family protein [Shimwellia pseudoproteus]MBJ3816328.1 flavodoxin family protein [Shimwellia pseudoproteus]